MMQYTGVFIEMQQPHTEFKLEIKRISSPIQNRGNYFYPLP